MTTDQTTAPNVDVQQWCVDIAEEFRTFERCEMAMFGDRDLAIVEWTIRCLGNPKSTKRSADVVAILADRHR